jgi:UDP-N-acetylmuramate--alanine ligase
MKIFFSGIGGSGVSAIAGFMAGRGDQVAGSDRLFDAFPEHQVCRRLKERGIVIFPQDGSGIDGTVDLAVFSTAVERSNPDFIKTERLGTSILTRPDYLAEIVSRFQTIAVAGTSGKSTVSGMLAFLMQRLGMGPNFIGGGRVKQFKAPGNPGNFLTGPSTTLVVEACESDGTLVNYMPSYTIISNLDLDHHPVRETAGMFERLAENTSGLVVRGGDDENLAACGIRNPVRFSIHKESEYRAGDIEYHRMKTLFTLNGRRFELSLPGMHNLYNALACISLLSELGVAMEKVADILPEFAGIERRFDVHLNDGRHLVVDDYAHNPHKILSLMKTMQTVSDKVCYLFQPHGYGPTRLMKDGYIRTFSELLRQSDALFLLPIYYAGGTAAKDISSGDIAEGVKASGRSASALEDRGLFFDLLGRWESYVVLGARDDSLSDFAEEIAVRLRSRAGPEVGRSAHHA